MTKKKTTTASTSSSNGIKTSNNKVKKPHITTENSKSESKTKLTLESSPQHSNHSTDQRRRSSNATLNNEESISKRRVSYRLNPNLANPISPVHGQDENHSPIKNKLNKPVVNHQTNHHDENITSPSINPKILAKAEAKKEEGNLHFKVAKYTDAIKCYSEAIDLNANNPAYLSNRAAASMALGDYQSALTDMELVNSSKFIQLGIQPSTKNVIRLIRCLLPLGKFYLARQNLNQLEKEYPDSDQVQKEASRLKNLESCLNCIQVSHRAKRWDGLLLELSNFEKQLDCGPLKCKEWLIWKVEGLCGQKKWENANALCNDLVRSYSSDPEVLYCRAKVMYSQGNLSATVSHCQEAMRLDPDFSNALNLLRRARNIENLKKSGNTCFKASDFKSAIIHYLEASSIDPTNETLLTTLDSNRAQALLKSGQNKEAIETCNKILKINSEHFKALRTRGRAKKAMSELQSAILDLESASKLAPTSEENSEILEDMKHIKALISRGDYVDHYQILGIQRNASNAEIKKAFHKQSLIHHPDKGGSGEKCQQVNEAYRVLRDPQLRSAFDRKDPDNPAGMFNHGRSGFPFRSYSSADADMPFSFYNLFNDPASRRGPPAYHSHAF